MLFREAGVRRPEDVVATFRQVYPDGVPGREPTDEDLAIEAAEILELVGREDRARRR